MLFKIQGKSEFEFDIKAQSLSESCEVKIMSLQQQLRELQDKHIVDKSKNNANNTDGLGLGGNSNINSNSNSNSIC